MGEEEKPVEEPVKVSDTLICPFCDGEMVQEPAREGIGTLVFRCKDCGFQATFIKEAVE